MTLTTVPSAEIDKMVLPDLEEFHKAKNELIKTIVAIGETEASSSAESLLRSLEQSLKRRIEFNVWDTTDALYRVNKMLLSESKADSES